MDIYKEVTDRIIAEMENGIIPWHKPWIASAGCVSHATGKPYSLLNQMLLGKPGEYIQNWLTVLKGDKKFIVSASGKAEKAVNYILEKGNMGRL